MFNWIVKKLTLKKKDTNKPLYEKSTDAEAPISKNIKVNIDKIKQIFSKSDDIVIREFFIGPNINVKAFIVYVDGLVNRELIQRDLLTPLMSDAKKGPKENFLLEFLESKVFSICDVKESDNFKDTVDYILSGATALFVDNTQKALILSTEGWAQRSIEEPDTEVVVRGPREGFTETLRTNTSLLRRKIKTPELKFESMTLGKRTNTQICICYIEGIADDKIVEEVKQRLSRIDTDSILESGYIEQFIEDAPLSFFPTIGNSEKPDTVAGKILEGRVAIITDGSPFVLTVPYIYIEAFQTSEDYFSRSFYVTIIRWIRFIAFFLSVFSPALYVALTTFHQEMIPPSLLVSVAAAREGVPFPAVVEALMMSVIFEILKEAGVRLPRSVGQAVSIVGALVIGEAAVSAGLIGAPMVIVTALTAISSFVVPATEDTATIMRLTYIILAGALGLFGIMLGVSFLLIHMLSLRSFGAPYFSPFSPTTFRNFKDVFIRTPWWAMAERPRVIGWKNPIRQKSDLKPRPPKKEKK